MSEQRHTGQRTPFLTTAFIAGLSVAIHATTAFALPQDTHKRAELFAKCVGQVEAQITATQARHFVVSTDMHRVGAELKLFLELTTPDALNEGVPKGQIVRWHAQGWSDHAHVLRGLHRTGNAPGRTLHRAEAFLQACRALVLGPGT